MKLTDALRHCFCSRQLLFEIGGRRLQLARRGPADPCRSTIGAAYSVFLAAMPRAPPAANRPIPSPNLETKLVVVCTHPCASISPREPRQNAIQRHVVAGNSVRETTAASARLSTIYYQRRDEEKLDLWGTGGLA